MLTAAASHSIADDRKEDHSPDGEEETNKKINPHAVAEALSRDSIFILQTRLTNTLKLTLFQTSALRTLTSSSAVLRSPEVGTSSKGGRRTRERGIKIRMDGGTKND